MVPKRTALACSEMCLTSWLACLASLLTTGGGQTPGDIPALLPLCFTSPCGSGSSWCRFPAPPLCPTTSSLQVCEHRCSAPCVAPIKSMCSCLHGVQSVTVSRPLPFRISDLALSPHGPEHRPPSPTFSRTPNPSSPRLSGMRLRAVRYVARGQTAGWSLEPGLLIPNQEPTLLTAFSAVAPRPASVGA